MEYIITIFCFYKAMHLYTLKNPLQELTMNGVTATDIGSAEEEEQRTDW